MKLIINGNANRTFAQTMCLIFFPGEKFPENDSAGGDDTTPVVRLDYKEFDDGIFASCDMTVGDDATHGEWFEKYRIDMPAYRTGKKSIGNAIYQAGVALMGSVPPWGILTGVRPAKISEEYIRQGLDYSDLPDALERDYHVTEPKSKLLTEITKVEMKAFSLAKPDTCSLYVSIPFCPSKCAYCSFVSYATKNLLSLIPEYLDRLICDIRETALRIKESGKRIITVYVGGGTPSILDADQIKRLLFEINSVVDEKSLLEFTFEAGRPDTITKEKLDAIVSYNVNRTSINPQTLNDKVLLKIGRKHTAEDFYRAYDIARSSGIKYINTDLIAGLPGDSFDSFRDTVDIISGMKPDNVTVHTFSAKRAAEFVTSQNRENVIYSYTGGDAGLSVDYSQKRLSDCGYEPYYIYRQKNTVGNLENVGFCLPGSEGLYNIFMMEELHDIYAVGAGAVTKILDTQNNKINRIFMPKYPFEYLHNDNQ